MACHFLLINSVFIVVYLWQPFGKFTACIHFVFVYFLHSNASVGYTMNSVLIPLHINESTDIPLLKIKSRKQHVCSFLLILVSSARRSHLENPLLGYIAYTKRACNLMLWNPEYQVCCMHIVLVSSAK